MRRREFIALVGAAAAAWPRAARAQQGAMPVIGILSPEWPNAVVAHRLRAFHEGLSETGYVKAATWPSNIAGRRAETISCRHSRPNWFVVR